MKLVLSIFFTFWSIAPFLQGQILTSSNLPIILIDTENTSIPDEPKITAWMGIIDNGPNRLNYISDTPNNFSGRIGIEIRGSSSAYFFPKKNYAVETRNPDGSNLNISLLGLPPENDWILHGPYSDKTLIRNILVYRLWRDMGRYGTRTRLCELMIDGNYIGVYVLMEKIKRDINRVDISTLNPEENSGDDLTGGYIIKVDKTAGANVGGWYSPIPPFPGAWQRIYYQYHYPKPDEISPQQAQYIQGFIADFEATMSGSNFNDPLIGYPVYLNVDSFIDYYLLNELSRNVDGYRLSAFMYKDKDSIDGRLTMGPVWDFNLAFGNANYYDGAEIDGIALEYLLNDDSFTDSDFFQVPFWWRKLIGDQDFQYKVGERWNALRTGAFGTSRLMGLVDSLVVELAEAQVRNYQAWDQALGQYVWPNAYWPATYEEEIDTLKSWITARLGWLDMNIVGRDLTDDETGDQIHLNPISLYQNFPNPFISSTSLAFELDSPTKVTLVISDIYAREIISLVGGEILSGTHEMVWDGLNGRGIPVSSGIYFARLNTAGFLVTIKMTLIK